MGRIASKMPKFCLNRIRPQARVRNSSPIQSNNHENPCDEKKDVFVDIDRKDVSGEKMKANSGRKVVVVVDSSMEAKDALQWTLSHTLQNQDILVLLHVIKPSKKDDQSNVNPKVPEILASMKKSCQVKRPEVQVEMVVVEGKDKGFAIVEAARAQSAALLVVGQNKRFITWRLMVMWAGSLAAGVAEYCVQNATCMAIAVRRKSKRLGGYLITTKRQKDFWLLA
ncbi:hypothetical protein CASFOL_020736 [Castilleja foliolosa]|uniref:UspA domain-containing protein n=1 Tax=Castilleja foliolosa TaxID=1961234 RepID=A0ABD3D4N8_9LAMI